MSNKVVLITGANRGIGLSFVKAFLKQGWEVHATARNPEKATELSQLGVPIHKLDVGCEQSIDQLPASFGLDKKLDLLLNNAGIYLRGDLSSVTSENLVEQFRVNSVGPILTTKALLPNLRKAVATSGSSTVVSITSRMGSIADNTSGGSYGYRASKVALNMMNTSLAIDLKSDNISAVLIHPGWIQTDMTSGGGDMGPEEAVERMMKLINSLDMNSTGKFFHRDGDVLPW